MASGLRIVFWGTRGMISSPSPQRAIFGGNTPCIQVLHRNDLILIDTGFGVSNFGEQLFAHLLKGLELNVHIFYTHFHWDHIQGLPFFGPIYFPNARLNLYSPWNPQTMIKNLDVLFDGSYSPFQGIHSMPSELHFNQIKGEVTIGPLKVRCAELDHGVSEGSTAYAYRFDNQDGDSITIASDHEARPSAVNDSLVEFAKDTNLLIHDAHFLDDEYPAHAGWGHSSISQALDNVRRIQPERCLLTHHAPHRSDADLQRVINTFKSKDLGRSKVEFAREEKIYSAEGRLKFTSDKAS